MHGTTSLFEPGISDTHLDDTVTVTYRKLEAVNVVDMEERACS